MYYLSILGFILALGANLFGGSGVAADELYGEAIPEDSSYVRALGFEQGQSLPEFEFELSEGGDFTVVLPGQSEMLNEGEVLTITPFGQIVHDAVTSVSKVQIAFFNAGYAAELSLKTADGKVEIVTAASENAAFREVNPLVIPVAVFKSDGILGEAFELKLVRGENPTIWVGADGTIEIIKSDVIWDE